MEVFRHPRGKLRRNARENVPKWLLIGIGGGGDIYGCLPLKWDLEQLGIEVHLGSLTWERDVVDPKSVPRRVSELEHAEIISPFGAIGGADTCLAHFCFQGALLSKRLGQPKILFADVNGGSFGVRDAIARYCELYDISGVVGVDVGGDSIALGTEPGLESPLADAITLAGIAQLPESCQVMLGVFGMNADGELTQGELLGRFSSLAPGYRGAIGHPPEAFSLMKDILADQRHVTEASRQPLRALAGEQGIIRIRNGSRHVTLNLLLTLTFLFDARVIFPSCPIAYYIKDARDIREADQRVRTRFGIETEYNP